MNRYSIGMTLISKVMSDKANDYDIFVVEDNQTATWVLVGYLVRYSKALDTFSCNCKSEVFGSKCSHKICAIRKCDKIPIKIKEALEEEEIIE